MENDVTAKILEEIKKYPFLESFLGKDWFEEILKTRRPKKHLFFHLFYDNTPRDHILIRSIERNLKIVLEILDKDELKYKKIGRLKGKIKNEDEILDILPELEWAAFLFIKDLHIIIEPTYPEEGPDLAIMKNGKWIFCEIKSIKFSERDEIWSYFYYEIRARIEKIKSSFLISLGFQKGFGKEDLFPIIDLIKNKIHKYQTQQLKTPFYVYYLGPSKDIERSEYQKDMNLEEIPYYKCRIEFIPIEESNSTCVSMTTPVMTGDDVDKIRREVIKKLGKFPKDFPGVLILDTSQRINNPFEVECAIFGRPEYVLRYEKSTGEYVGTIWRREKNSLFSSHSSLSALIIHRRKILNDSIFFDREFNRNPNAKHPLTDEEAQLFGKLMN